MSYDLSNDAEQPPPAKLPAISTDNLRRVRMGGLVLALAVFLVLIAWWAKTACLLYTSDAADE